MTGKGAKERAILVHDRLHAVLTSWRAASTDPRWVFPSPLHPGRPASTRYLADRIKEVGEAAAASKRVHPHLLRHTFATRLLDTGSDIRDVQEALGHSSPATTAIYTRVRPARLAEAVGRLDF